MTETENHDGDRGEQTGDPDDPSRPAAADDRERSGDALLSIDELTAGYGVGTVLHGLNVRVNRGEIVSLVGRNGAGKTTTLRSVVGHVPQIQGRITYDGEDVAGLAPNETIARGIAFVPEERRAFPGLTVRENLEIARLGDTPADEARSVDDILETFENLRENEDSLGMELSGGEQQMLVIGRALVSGADMLMLDEPTEGLAPFIVEQVKETIETLHEEGLTVLLVEQNVNVALDVADYHYVLNKGEIVHHGGSEELRENEGVLDRYLGVSMRE